MEWKVDIGSGMESLRSKGNALVVVFPVRVKLN
jgi:hypothetical protein